MARDKNGSDRVSFDDLIVLLDNLWITRMWTYQEILLASNPILVVGSFHLQWSLLERAIIFLQYSGTYHHSQPRLNQVLEAWIELVLSRDQLVAVQGACSNPLASESSQPSPDPNGLQPTHLLQYRDSVIEVAEAVNQMRALSLSVAGYTFFLAFIVGVAAGFGTIIDMGVHNGFVNKSMKERLQSMLNASDDAIGPITACLQACQNPTAATCLSTCKNVKNTVSELSLAISDLSSPADSWNRAVWTIAFPSIIGLLLLLSVLSISFANFMGQRTAGPLYPPNDTTLNLVKGLCTRECSDIKDKALAMHAVLQRLSSLDVQLTDTTLPVRKSYRELSKNIIEVTRSLALLIPAAIQRFDDNPSWIPDWSAQMDPFWISPPLFDGHPADATPGSHSIFSWDDQDENVLTVSGILREGTVFECYQFLETSDMYEPKDEAKHFKNLEMMLRFWNCVRVSEAVTKILTMLSGTDSCGLSGLKPRHFKEWINFFIILRGDDPTLVFSLFRRRKFKNLISVLVDTPAGLSTAQLRSRFILAVSSHAKVWKTHITICNALARGRRVLFSISVRMHYIASQRDPRQRAHQRRREEDVEGTSRSIVEERGVHYDIADIGIACDTVQPGDNIILVGGVRTPLVIRATSELYTLVSPALIPSLMAGHGWNDSLKNEDLTKFSLS